MTQLAPPVSPGARNGTAMVFDEARGVAVLYGGFRIGAGVPNDTWEWDGTNWAQRLPAANPGVLNGHAMAYDARRGVAVLFGGARSGSLGVAETWEWDGTNWSQRATGGPVGRVNHQLAYDRARGVVVDYNAGPNLGDTWEWDGTNWTQRVVAGPPLRTYHAMAYDAARGRTVLFGGRTDGNVSLADTWEWDGANWTQVVTTASPGSRYAYGFCWDARRHRVLFFGGYQGGQRNDTWSYGADVGASYAALGTGCPGNGGVPTINPGGALPWIGEVFAVQVTGLAGGTIGILGASDSTWLAVPLPLDLTPFGILGCRLYVSFDLTVTLAPSGGAATWSTPLPNVAALVGQRFFQQVASLSPGTNPVGVVTSNYGRATMGAR